MRKIKCLLPHLSVPKKRTLTPGANASGFDGLEYGIMEVKFPHEDEVKHAEIEHPKYERPLFSS